jgi:glycosyltransferase involved in cell wall biosynthesis
MKNKSISFSVLMAVYAKDNAALFDRALMSIFKNTLQPYQIILVVNGPLTPLLNSIIRKYLKIYKKRLILLRLDKNYGLAIALNEGLKLVKAEYVARADADDYNYPIRFESQQKLMQRNIDLFGSQIKEAGENEQFSLFKKVPLRYKDILSFSKKRNPFNHMTVCFRTKFAKDCGGYPNLDLREDYGFWIKMIKTGASCVNQREVLVEANTGSMFFKRRGGYRAIKAEFFMQYFMVQNQYLTYGSAFFNFLLKSFIFILPAYIRFKIYKIYLRD